jgi:hypothetical protein
MLQSAVNTAHLAPVGTVLVLLCGNNEPCPMSVRAAG